MSNLSRMRTAMEAAGLPAMLLSNIDSVQWATGFNGSAGMVVLTPTSGAFITDSRYTLQAQEQVSGIPVQAYGGATPQLDFVKGILGELGIKKIGFESDSLTYNAYTDWKNKFEGIELVPTPGFVTPLKTVKTEDEIAKVREACKLADANMEHVTRLIQPGVSEWDIGLDIEFFFRRQGAEIAFDPIVASGWRSALPHGRASQKKLEHGDFVTLDFGCKLDGYCSDITRTFVVGHASERHEQIYGAVLDALEGSKAAIAPGKTGKEIDQVARDIFGKVGLAEYFGHGLGHGLGRLVHDAGGLSPRSTTAIEPNQIFTVEPGVYIEGFGGVRIEDDIVVREHGIDVLTMFPRELMVLP